MKTTQVKLLAYTSIAGNNPLSKYVPCKAFCKTRKGKNQKGREYISVTTTKEFIEIIGWVEDNKYIED